MVLKELYRDADGDEVNQINDFLMCTDTANNVWGKKKRGCNFYTCELPKGLGDVMGTWVNVSLLLSCLFEAAVSSEQGVLIICV